MTQYTLSFAEVGRDDVQRCGGKGANLGELTRAGARVPPGFCIGSDALPYVIEANGLGDQIAQIASELNFDDPNAVEVETSRIRALMGSAELPQDLEVEILGRYRTLLGGEERHVAVRSSVAVKDSQISSFPGMMDTYHYVLGEEEVLAHVGQCWASVWTTRAAYARHRQDIAHDRSLIAPVIQLMVDADTAGVLFTANPMTGDRGEIIIESNWGIGESVVSGKSMNDFFVINKDDLSVKQSMIARKNVMFTMDRARGSGRLEQEVPEARQASPTLSATQLVILAETGKQIESHFGFPSDIEWAFQDGALYILQARRIRDLKDSPGGE